MHMVGALALAPRVPSRMLGRFLGQDFAVGAPCLHLVHSGTRQGRQLCQRMRISWPINQSNVSSTTRTTVVTEHDTSANFPVMKNQVILLHLYMSHATMLP